MFQRYMLRSLLTQSFNIVNTPIILLFSKKWVPGFAAEDNKREYCSSENVFAMLFCQQKNNYHAQNVGIRRLNIKCHNLLFFFFFFF